MLGVQSPVLNGRFSTVGGGGLTRLRSVPRAQCPPRCARRAGAWPPPPSRRTRPCAGGRRGQGGVLRTVLPAVQAPDRGRSPSPPGRGAGESASTGATCDCGLAAGDPKAPRALRPGGAHGHGIDDQGRLTRYDSTRRGQRSASVMRAVLTGVCSLRERSRVRAGTGPRAQRRARRAGTRCGSGRPMSASGSPGTSSPREIAVMASRETTLTRSRVRCSPAAFVTGPKSSPSRRS